MQTSDWLQLVVLIVALGVSIPILGGYMAKVFGGGSAPGDRMFLPIERLIYRLCRVDAERGFVGRGTDPQGLAGDADASAVQGAHGDLEALTFLSQAVLEWDTALLEDHLHRPGSPDADH